jgi:hypothetical protein
VSAQSRASSFNGMVSENPVHVESLSLKKSCKVPAGTSKDEYKPFMFKNLYAAVCSRGDNECEIGDPRTAALIN